MRKWNYNHQQAGWDARALAGERRVAEAPTVSSTQNVLGSVVSLWRYPVKSMMGEELNAAEVTKGGLLGDRAYALIDTCDGKVATAKNPRKWLQLFDFRAALTDDPKNRCEGAAGTHHPAGWRHRQ